jgi:hypothetical protein
VHGPNDEVYYIIDDETKKKKVKVHQVAENCDANKLEV